MFLKIYASQEVAEVLSAMGPNSISLIAARVAGSPEVAIMNPKVAQAAVAAGKKQDSVIFEGVEVISGDPGPWKSARFVAHWSTTNGEMLKVTDQYLKDVASPCFAEMMRGELIPLVSEDEVAAYLHCEPAAFSRAKSAILAARRAALANA